MPSRGTDTIRNEGWNNATERTPKSEPLALPVGRKNMCGGNVRPLGPDSATYAASMIKTNMRLRLLPGKCVEESKLRVSTPAFVPQPALNSIIAETFFNSDLTHDIADITSRSFLDIEVGGAKCYSLVDTGSSKSFSGSLNVPLIASGGCKVQGAPDD